jgi:hypothetical protein
MTAYSPEALAKRLAAAAIARAARAEILVDEIEFLIMCGEGEAAILAKLGYGGKKEALKRQLSRIGKHHLIPRIFEHDAELYDRRISQ